MMLRFWRVGVYTEIEAHGGLLSKAGLAERWGVTQQYLGKVTRRADFPTAIPIDGGKRKVWLASEADAWHHTSRRSTE